MDLKSIREKWAPAYKNAQASVGLWEQMAQNYATFSLDNLCDDPFFSLLVRENLVSANASVLDVGCGGGKYSIALSSRCKEVVGMDFSPQMIAFSRRNAEKYGCFNATFLCADWQELSLADCGFQKRFDLVLAHMTPAVADAASFEKLMEASRSFCVFSKPTRRHDAVLDALIEHLGIENRRRCDESIAYAFSLLYLMGIDPRIAYEKRSFLRSTPLKQAIPLYVSRLKTMKDLSGAEEKEIPAFLQAVQKDGLIEETTEMTVSTLYWHV